MKKLKKKNVIFLIKVIISSSLLAFIINKINWHEVFINLKNASVSLLILVFILGLLERIELTYKWNILIKARGLVVSFWKLFSINLIGGFWGLFLPSSLGTDVVRGYYLIKNNSEKAISVSSVFVDRILGMFSLLLFAFFSVIFAQNLISEINITWYIISILIIVSSGFYFFQKESTAMAFKKLFKKIKINFIADNLVKLHSSILVYKNFPKAVLYSFFVTLFVQLTRVLMYYFLSLAYNVHVPIIYFFLFIPIIMLVIMIPVSIGGLGVREGTFVAFFSLVGMSVNDAVLISFTNSIINNLTTMIGGLVYLFYKPDNKKVEKKTPIPSLKEG